MPDTLTRDEAERLILDEMAIIAERLRSIEKQRDECYDRRRELYGRGRGLHPPVSGRRMAEASGVTDAALVLSARPGRGSRRKATSG